MKKLALFLITAAIMNAQVWTNPPVSGYSTLNTFLTSLIAGNSGASVPSGGCTPGKDLWADTTSSVLYFCGSSGWVAVGGGAWGSITGTLSSQTDLQTALNGKQATITLGTTSQYFRGNLTLATFPTDLASFSNGPGYLTANQSITFSGGCTGSGTTSITLTCGGSMTWPSAPGIAVYAGGSAWGTSLTAPTGSIVGTSDTQTLTNKTLDGVSPATMAFLDATSSVQTQLNGKAASGASTTVAGQTCALGSTCSIASTNLSDTAHIVLNNQSNTYSTGTQNFGGAAHTLPAKNGLVASLPGTCAVGEEYFATDATAGQNKYLCTATNTWTQQSGGGGSPGGSSGNLQTNNGSGSFSGQANIYSGIYGSGTERQLGMNCTPVATIPYTAFTAASVSQQIAIATVPNWWFPTSILLSESTPFACASGGGCTNVTSLAASIGTLSNAQYYVQPLVLEAGNFKADSVNGQPAQLTSHTLYVQVSVTNSTPGNLGTGSATSLTAGALQVAVCGGTYQ